jgi:hypothetical protein
MGAVVLIAGVMLCAAAVAEPGGGRGGYGYRGGGYGGWRGGYRGWYGGYGWGWGGLAFGLYFAALPLYYSTLWWGGVPYYYAYNNFYVWNGAAGAYETVNPPPALANQVAMQAPASPDLIVYPNNGQTSEQQAKDRYECHRWAANQTGFDPTSAGVSMAGAAQSPAANASQPPAANAGQPPAVNAPPAAAGKREEYLRAQAACLEGRGYTAR